MLFVTFTAVYLFRHVAGVFDSRTHTYVREWVRVTLPVRLLLVNTFVLVLSSLTIEMARRAVTREMVLAPVRTIPGIALGRERGVPWLALTVALGLLFLGGQWMAWEALGASGFGLATSASSSFVYILTGSHALHLAGGIIVLLYAGIIALLHHPVEQRRIVIEIAARYWHFMSVLWAYIFALLQFAR
jgi:cytochrome c oxidase subunit 3